MNTTCSLAGKSIWVTGGAGYLGSAITEALDAAGARVVCLDVAGKAAALVREKGLCHTLGLDLDVGEVEALPTRVEALVAEHGLPDGLAHLPAASSTGRRLEDLSAGEFQSTFDRSLTPTFVLCRALAEPMAARGSGSVVLFSSMYGMVAPDPKIYRAPMTPNPIDYGAAKAAILQLSRYFAVHYGPAGVRFNCITPGPFPNPGVRSAHPVFIEDLGMKTALGRIGLNTEIAGPTLFLLSDGASYVTGHSLVVDGGWTAW